MNDKGKSDLSRTPSGYLLRRKSYSSWFRALPICNSKNFSDGLFSGKDECKTASWSLRGLHFELDIKHGQKDLYVNANTNPPPFPLDVKNVKIPENSEKIRGPPVDP